MNVYDMYPEMSGKFDTLGTHPHDIPAVGIFDEPTVKVCINAKWLSHVTGMIERLLYLDAWNGTEAERYSAIDKITKIIAEFDKPENQGICNQSGGYMNPYYVHFHFNSRVLNGNAIKGQERAGQELEWFWQQFTPAINDAWEFKVTLPAGTYKIDMCHNTTASAGIVALSLNGGTAFLTKDMYTLATVYSVHTTTTITIPADGTYTIGAVVTGKNASSSGYYCNVSYVAFRPN